MTTIEELNKELENLLDAADHEVEESALFRDTDETKKQLPLDVAVYITITLSK